MTEETKGLKEKADVARMQYMVGDITREEATENIMPYLNFVNMKAEELAKKYHLRPRRTGLISFLR